MAASLILFRAMFNAVIAATLRLLTFRAGPQDFPFSATPGLTRSCVIFAIVAMALPEMTISSAPGALIFGLTMVLAIFWFLRVLLRLRKLENRFQQTFNSLLCVISALSLLTLPARNAAAPTIRAMQQKLVDDPTIGESGDRFMALLNDMQGAVPQAASFMISVIGLWQLIAVTRLLRHASDTTLIGSVGLTVLYLLNLFIFTMFAQALIQVVGS
jgi:hypothetical protein